MDDLPVATLRPNGSSITVYYVHADNLGTPRKITNPAGNTVVWRWDPDTYGTASASIATIAYNLRFPGQYYLPETELYYNYFREHDPTMGRYLESDPIGLQGGINTYTYVGDNPRLVQSTRSAYATSRQVRLQGEPEARRRPRVELRLPNYENCVPPRCDMGHGISILMV